MCGNLKAPRFFVQNNYYNDSMLNIFIINKVIIFQARDFIDPLAVYIAIVLDIGIKQHSLIDSITKKGMFRIIIYHLLKYEH